MRREIVVSRRVAGCRNKQLPGRRGSVDRILQRLAVPAATPTVARQLDELAESGRILYRQDRISRAAATAGVQELQRNELDRPVDTHHAKRVIADRADRPRAMRSVKMVVVRIVVVIDEVPPIDVVHVPVAIIVDAVARDLARVRPQVRHQVFVSAVDTRINHRHHNVAVAG